MSKTYIYSAFEGVTFEQLIKACYNWSNEPFYKYINKNTDPVFLNKHTGKPYTKGSIHGYCSKTKQILHVYQIDLKNYTNVIDLVLYLANQPDNFNKCGYTSPSSEQHNLARSLFNHIKDFLHPQIKSSLGTHTLKVQLAHQKQEIKNLNKIQIKLKSEINQKDQTIREYDKTIEKIRPLNQSDVIGINGLQQLKRFVALNENDHKKKDKLISELTIESANKEQTISQLTSEYNFLKEELACEKQKNSELASENQLLKEENEEANRNIQEILEKSTLLEDTLQALENKKPPDDFLNQRQINESVLDDEASTYTTSA